MAGIQTGIQLNDQFTDVMYGILESMNMAIQQMGVLQQSMEQEVDPAPWQEVQEEIAQTTAKVDDFSAALSGVGAPIVQNTYEQEKFNRKVQAGVQGADRLQRTLAKAGAALFSGMAVKKAYGFIEECTEAFDTQRAAEIQLMTVLGNMLDADYVSQFEVEVSADTSEAMDDINAMQENIGEVVVPVSAGTKALNAAFDQITEKAAEIQSRGIYGDEAMIAAGAEFATYFTDADAITLMMDTLANYAMGMNGVEEIDASGMVNFATNLGKIMSGSYDAMNEKGFTFTEAQKAIIEGTATQQQVVAALGEEYLNMSADMQAAAAITQVIDEYWAGLYETMSDTPQGKVIQLKNAFGDLKEVVGEQLYPYIAKLVDVITDNWDTIEEIVQGFTTGLQFALGVLTWLVEGAINFSSFVVDNWPWISKIVMGIVAAFLAYQAVSTIVSIAMGIMTIAQTILNLSMMGCPVMWIVLGFLVLIAVLVALVVMFYKVIAKINELAGTSISATGLILAVFFSSWAAVGNIFVALFNFITDVFAGLRNLIAAFANFFGNVFDDPVGSVARLFFDLADTVLALLEAIASAVDTLFGSNLTEAVSGWRDSLSDWVDQEYGQGKEIMAKVNPQEKHLQRYDFKTAWNMGYNLGSNVEDFLSDFSISDLFNTEEIPSLEELMEKYGAGFDPNDYLGGIEDNTGQIADLMGETEEDLKYIRDMAEQDTVNRFTIAEVHIEQTNHNNISSDMDLDGVVTGLTDAVNESIDIMTEGVHA